MLRINRLGGVSSKSLSTVTTMLTLGIDFTARDLQRECKARITWKYPKRSTILLNRNFYPKDELGDLNGLNFRLD